MFAFAAFGQRNLFAATGSGAKGLARRLAMEAAARRRHPGAAGGPGAQPGASFLPKLYFLTNGSSYLLGYPLRYMFLKIDSRISIFIYSLNSFFNFEKRIIFIWIFEILI